MESKTGKQKSSTSASMLGPGFRFHPTDEELVRYYLKRKIFKKAFRFDAISEIDIYKAEPWDLPYMSKLKTRDLEWYFFSVLDKKYGNGARTNRATEKGYWKTTGKDRAVYHKTQIVGMKKTLVYHSGRAPKGQRTNWVMHEYRLTDIQLETAEIAQDAFVLCRVFQKSGSGPKNGEQYGAPFVEEEWDDDELELDPENEAIEEVDFGLDDCLDGHDIQQLQDSAVRYELILGSDVSSNVAPLPQYADGSYVEETTKSFDNNQNLLVRAGYQYCVPKQCDDKNIYSMSGPYDMNVKEVELGAIGGCSKFGNSGDVDYLLDEPFLDSSDNLQDGDVGFLKASDLSNPIETDTTAFDMLEEYLTFFDANDDNSLFFANDPAMMLGSEDLFSNQYLPQKELVEGIESAILPSEQFIGNHNYDAASSSDRQETAKYHSDFQHPFVKQASQMLGGVPAPPAFAAEFPSKDAVRRLNYVPQSSVRVTADVIQIRNSKMVGNGTERASVKHENVNIVLSFGFSQVDDGSSSLESSVSILPGKTVSTVSRCWLYFMFFWVLILSMSVKIGTYIYAN
ncbi:hypothetical protein DH2020_021544 [Rehmannia glutinosa]|uniref:NAC domain-containing protein n=1 Tax=Rehmannia glutinosa TaxID=99300 RepID=A0ABR0WF67_REHGL